MSDKLTEEQMAWTLERITQWEKDFNDMMLGREILINWNSRALAAGAVRANIARMIDELKEKK